MFQPILPGSPLFNTQKARGLVHLARSENSFGLPVAIIYGVFPINPNFPSFPFFARPCPVTPRHGFVESRVVMDANELARVVWETYTADKKAEIIFMPFLKGQYSAVVTPYSVTIGAGNDGATSGKKVLLSLATDGSAKKWNGVLLCTQDYINLGPEECCFLEVVAEKNTPKVVQARIGPVVKGVKNFIPEDIEVKTVIAGPFSMDLLQWEAAVKDFGPGTVVWWPDGALTSHYAIHCVQAGIPFLTQKEYPKVGDVLKKEGVKRTRFGEVSLKKIRDAFVEVLKKDEKKPLIGAHMRNVELAMSVAHSQHLWPCSPTHNRLRAEAMVWMLRYGAAACVGEARHFYTSGPGRPTNIALANELGWSVISPEYARKPRLTAEWFVADPTMKETKVSPALKEKYGVGDADFPTFLREYVYHHNFTFSLTKAIYACNKARHDLAPPGWCNGVGGVKWVRSAAAVVTLYWRLRAFIRNPTKKAWSSLCAAWNVAANSVHNNGCFINKWSVYAGTCSDIPAVGFLRNLPYLYKLTKEAEEETGKEVESEEVISEEEEEEEKKEAEIMIELGVHTVTSDANTPNPTQIEGE